jgi:predicted AAA+ superfamily ATPase
MSFPVLESYFKGKISAKLMTRLFLNPLNTVYLRGLEKEFGVSSNTVRNELNKLHAVKLIETVEHEDGNQKQYRANPNHPLFANLRGFVMQQFGLDALIEKVFDRLGKVEAVYLTHDWAEGKTGPFLDLVVVGKVDQVYMHELIQKAEPLIDRKIRVAVYGNNNNSAQWESVPNVRLI